VKVTLVGSYLGHVTKTVKDKVTGEIRLLNYLRLLVDNDVVDVYLRDGFKEDGYNVMDQIVIEADVRAKDNKLLFRSLQ